MNVRFRTSAILGGRWTTNINEVHHPPGVLLTKTIAVITIANRGPVYVAGNYFLLQEIVHTSTRSNCCLSLRWSNQVITSPEIQMRVNREERLGLFDSTWKNVLFLTSVCVHGYLYSVLAPAVFL